MNKSQMIAVYDQDQRKEIEFADMRREVTSNVVRHIDTSSNREGMITYSALEEANAEDVIREQVRYFEGIGQDFDKDCIRLSWLCGHRKPKLVSGDT